MNKGFRLVPSFRLKFFSTCQALNLLEFPQLLAHVTMKPASYDRRTIPPLLKAWAEAERKHGG
jgi:hypothetical protein